MIDRLSAWVVLGVALFCAAPVNAQHIEPFEHGWTLETASSEIRFLSVKNGSITEMHRFDSFAGSIDADGVVQLTVPLDSVNTGIDLRNVRMRFMFFETFLFPEATVTTSLDAGQLINLPKERRKRLALPFKISLHGIELDLGTEVTVTLIDKDRVSVASSTPMTLPLAPFGLDTGLTKLEEAGQVDIVPVAITSFDLIFARNASGFVNPVTVPEVNHPTPRPSLTHFPLWPVQTTLRPPQPSPPAMKQQRPNPR